jgi:hypothetical protein
LEYRISNEIPMEIPYLNSGQNQAFTNNAFE